MMRLAATFLTGLLLLAGPAMAEEQPAAEPTSGAPKTDTAPITDAGFGLDDVGFFVVDLKDGRVVAEYNADKPFIPASVAKIATIAAGLTILGGDHTFTTTLFADGAVKDGVLSGSLILKGGGDPFLTGDDLQAMARDLAAAGIKKVDGAFVYDATGTIEVPQINAMQPEAAGYNTGVSALSVNFNRVRVDWQKGAKAASAIAAAVSEHVTQPVETISLAFADQDPAGPYVRVGVASEDRWLLSPDLAAKGQDWLPVGNPSLVTAEVFRALAAAEGIALPEPTAGPAPEGVRTVAEHESIPLTNIARAVLRYSNNLSAELIGLAASHALTGRSLSLADSASALAAWWKLRLPDADWNGMVLANHSGLSSDSRTTPRQIVTMLEEAAKSAGGADFHDLLKPIGWKGVKGTARIKTGTMSYARGLAGYIDTAAGNRLAFAIFFNDREKRAALDAAFDPRVKDIDPASRTWRNRALKVEEKYTTGWAETF
ncbi:MAG: D-alanyl-D-alanine carboxypeptidase/D-alanyl-D-alanine-endopeptidase [Bauldia sp.]|nr:D-alanyl-D-alanine carboxypeptidase/D-alanyl-D-alanine-endopeptidase [Bauldia sp.]